MDIKQLNRRDLMALGTADAGAELQERKDRVDAAMAIIAKIKSESGK